MEALVGVYLFVVVPLCFCFEISLCSELHCLRLCFGKNLDYLQLSCESRERMRTHFVKLAHSRLAHHVPCVAPDSAGRLKS